VVLPLEFFYSKTTRVRRPNPLGIAVFLLCLLVLGGNSLALDSGTWAVSVEGKPVAQVSDFESLERALYSLKSQYGEIESQPVPWARVNAVRVSGGGAAVSAQELEDRLADALGFAREAVAVRIDGEKRFVFADRSEAREFLNRVLDSYTVEEGAERRFLEDVQLVGTRVRCDEVTGLDEALFLARQDIENVQKHVVREGDTLWDVAAEHRLSAAQLLASNPAVKETSILRIGDELVIARHKPLLTVVTTAQVVKTREIPYRTTVRRDPGLPVGQRKVLEAGAAGLEEVTLRVVRQNGRLVAQERLKARETKPVVNRVEAAGSKIILASRGGGGQLAWPAGGGVISPFGPRGGGFHSGIDIGAGHGAPVVAAGPGVVVRAGWHGGYGKVIDISHGNGVVTRYAHLSSVAKSAGQEVDRAQYIGAVGSTGRSTGPHLHFEVLINGRAQNPLNYL